MTESLWTIILAAGAGRRLASLTGDVPKQFWRAGNRTSLLEDTADRFAPVAPLARTVVVVDDGHRRHLGMHLGDRVNNAAFVFQPEDRGTAAGVFFALLTVLDIDPHAAVVITPSDHGVGDAAAFRQGVVEAARHVRVNGGVVLFGVEPTGAHDDYGWITPGPMTSMGGLRPVTSFVEKPPSDVARRLFATGAVWNTMVIVATANALRNLYLELLPRLAEVFESALRLPRSERTALLASAYPALPTFDFCRDLLTPERRLSTYVWPVSMGWSDLGTPERLRAWQPRDVVHRPTAAFSRRDTLPVHL